MKKVIGLVLVFVLVFALTANAFAGSRPKITRQPESATVKKGGTVSFSIRTSGTVKTVIWYFVDPATENTYTGKQLSGTVKGVKVQNPNSTKITLRNVPEALHGWLVYAHVNGNGYKVDSDIVQLLISGLDVPGENKETDLPPDTGSDASAEEHAATEQPAEEASPAEDKPAGGQQSGRVTVTASSGILKKLDASGNVVDDSLSSSLEFDDCGNVLVTSEDPIISLTLNLICIHPDQPVKEFMITNITSDLVVDITVESASPVTDASSDEGTAEPEDGDSMVPGNEDSAEPGDEDGTVPEDEDSEEPEDDDSAEPEEEGGREPEDEDDADAVADDGTDDSRDTANESSTVAVDESRMCKVTCKGCTFTYVRGRLASVTEGEVPAGSPINISAASADLAAKGYRINGSDPQYIDKPGFRIIVDGDMEIICK